MSKSDRYPEASVEIFGRDTVFAEGFVKIEEYQSETVKLKYKNFRLRIIGENLTLSDIKSRAVVIMGRIFTLDYTD